MGFQLRVFVFSIHRYCMIELCFVSIRLTDAEIEKMIHDAAKFKKADQQAKKRRESPRNPSSQHNTKSASNILFCAARGALRDSFRRLDEIQAIERQISDIKSSLDGALGNSIDDDSKVLLRGKVAVFLFCSETRLLAGRGA
jgi:molecular chaperone DnaK (HSP70)